MDPAPSRSPWPRILLGLAVVAVLVWLFASGTHRSLSPVAVREHLHASGPWGPLVFVAAFAALQPFGLSAHVFIVAASLMWPPAIAVALATVGTLAAASVAFAFARHMGSAWVQARLPARLRRWDDRLATHGFRTVVLLRILFFTFAPLQLMLGVSRISFATYFFASLVGLAPMIVVESLVGGSLFALVFG